MKITFEPKYKIGDELYYIYKAYAPNKKCKTCNRERNTKQSDYVTVICKVKIDNVMCSYYKIGYNDKKEEEYKVTYDVESMNSKLYFMQMCYESKLYVTKKEAKLKLKKG